MQINLKQKYFLVALGSLVIFVILGFVVHDLIIKNILSPPGQRMEMMPPIFLAKIIDRINPENKIGALAELQSWQADFPGPKMVLLDDQGQVLYPKNFKSPLDWNRLQKPQQAYQFTKIKLEELDFRRGFGAPMMLPPAMRPPNGERPPPLPPFEQAPAESVLIKLQDAKSLYLLILPFFEEFHSQGLKVRPRKPFLPWIGIISMLVSLILGIGVAVSLIYSSVSKQVKVADEVITRLQHGDLKARFPVRRNDEFGKAMSRFINQAESNLI